MNLLSDNSVTSWLGLCLLLLRVVVGETAERRHSPELFLAEMLRFVHKNRIVLTKEPSLFAHGSEPQTQLYHRLMELEVVQRARDELESKLSATRQRRSSVKNSLAAGPLQSLLKHAHNSRRQKRSADKIVQEAVCSNGCCRHQLLVDLQDALPGLTVEKPAKVDIGYCAPTGENPCLGSTIYATLLRRVRPDAIHCIPTSYDELAVVYENQDTNEHGSSFLPNASVRTCGCG